MELRRARLVTEGNFGFPPFLPNGLTRRSVNSPRPCSNAWHTSLENHVSGNLSWINKEDLFYTKSALATFCVPYSLISG